MDCSFMALHMSSTYNKKGSLPNKGLKTQVFRGSILKFRHIDHTLT